MTLTQLFTMLFELINLFSFIISNILLSFISSKSTLGLLMASLSSVILTFEFAIPVSVINLVQSASPTA